MVRAARWGAELATVFVGVYAAFMLNNYQSHRQEQQRREQILGWLEGEYGDALDDTRRELTRMRKDAADFKRQLDAGEMPVLHGFDFATDYDPSDMSTVLGSGGFDLLEVETVRDIRDTENTLRLIVATTRHDQQLSDTLVLPNLDKERDFFYDPATHKLRPMYRWYGRFFDIMLQQYADLVPQMEKLVKQIRADRQRNR